MRTLKTYYISVNESDETGLSFVSFVTNPAIEVNWLAFDEDEPLTTNFSIDSEEQRIVYAPAIVANKPIYRRKDDYEFQVVFTPESIKKIVEKYSAEGLLNSVDFQHNETPIKDVIMIQSFIVDREKGIAPNGVFSDIPDGSWMCSFKINNDELWEQVKNGTVKGFSVAGSFILNEKIDEQDFVCNEDWVDKLIDEIIKNDEE